nr:putative reverse transcriptase domain-containing protein [Tanacetum cinerariifolium]
MDLHVVSRACHHLDGLVRFSKGSDDMSGYIVGISKPSNKESGTEITEGLVFNAELLDRVFKVYRPENRQERRSGNRKSLQQSSILKSLAMWEKDNNITTLVKGILNGSALGSFGQGGGNFLEEGATGNTNIKQSLRKVADRHFTAAIKVLSSSGVASYCDDTIKALEAKHPYKSPPSMPSITFSEPPLVAEIDSVFSCIKFFPKGTSCGRDGLRAQHILDALCGEGSATVTDLLKVITSVVNLWLAGRCQPILAEFVASAPLTPLFKPDNGIRPIVVGTIWRRLVSKVAMKGVGKEMSKYLSDFQFGVGVSGGAEAILHSVNRVLSEYHNDGSLAMLTVDFSNAFNLVDRSALRHEVRVKCPSISLWVNFLYGQASRLYIGDTHIWSATEVQQGDPLGPLIFALILHPLLHKIKDSCKLLLHAWYLDDVTVIEDSKKVARVLDIIKRLSSSVKLLGGAISRDAYFISGLAMRRVTNAIDLMGLLPQLHDPQSELLLLRSFFECLRVPHAQDFLLAIPIDGLGQHMSPLEYHKLPRFKYRHDMVKDFLFDICRRAGISAKKEASVNFLTDPSDGRSTLRPADVLVFGWVGRKHACMDLTGVSPLAGLSSRGSTAGQAALKAASSKAVELLSRVQRVMHINGANNLEVTTSTSLKRRALLGLSLCGDGSNPVDDEDMIQELAKEYMNHLERGKKIPQTRTSSGVWLTKEMDIEINDLNSKFVSMSTVLKEIRSAIIGGGNHPIVRVTNVMRRKEKRPWINIIEVLGEAIDLGLWLVGMLILVGMVSDKVIELMLKS